ncbi:MAG: response regulator transcription factor [Acidimicrobiia bacterium]
MSETLTPEPRTVLLVDDDDTRRDLLHEALERSGFVTLVAHEPGQATLAASSRPVLSVVALSAPTEAVDEIRQIATAAPDCLLVFLGGADADPVVIMQAMEAGVIACIVEPFNPDALPDVLEHVLAGEAVLPGAVVNRLVDRLLRHRVRNVLDESGREALTRREWQVLELLGEGLDTRQIAARLFVASVTVRSHIAAVLRKLDLPNRDAAIDLFNDP